MRASSPSFPLSLRGVLCVLEPLNCLLERFDSDNRGGAYAKFEVRSRWDVLMCAEGMGKGRRISGHVEFVEDLRDL